MDLNCLILEVIHVLYTDSSLLRKSLEPFLIFSANRRGGYKGALVILDEHYLSLSRE